MKRKMLLQAISAIFGLLVFVWPASACWDGTTIMYYGTTAIRLDGNTVKLNAHAYMSGDYYNYWEIAANTNWYFNSTLESSSGWTYGSIGASYDTGYTPTLQTYGPGAYTQNSSNDAYTPYCGGWTWSGVCDVYGCVYPPPWGSSASISISRPARPDYASGYPRALWFIGGVTSDGAYNAQTVFTPGTANGAPESPVYVISYGSDRLSLNCTNCTGPTATAIASSGGCQTYDVQINSSYNGFLSDPFYLFINRPWNTVAASDPYGGVWNYTTAWGNGWDSRINYTTSDICSSTMSGYSMNEAFGSWNPDYYGTSWTPASPNGWSVGAAQWFDDMSFQCPGGNCTPMPQNPPTGCYPNCGTVKVQSATQTFRVGSTSYSPNLGLAVQQNTHQRWQDHGTHDSITTPIP